MQGVQTKTTWHATKPEGHESENIQGDKHDDNARLRQNTKNHTAIHAQGKARECMPMANTTSCTYQENLGTIQRHEAAAGEKGSCHNTRCVNPGSALKRAQKATKANLQTKALAKAPRLPGALMSATSPAFTNNCYDVRGSSRPCKKRTEANCGAGPHQAKPNAN